MSQSWVVSFGSAAGPRPPNACPLLPNIGHDAPSGETISNREPPAAGDSCSAAVAAAAAAAAARSD